MKKEEAMRIGYSDFKEYKKDLAFKYFKEDEIFEELLLNDFIEDEKLIQEFEIQSLKSCLVIANLKTKELKPICFDKIISEDEIIGYLELELKTKN